MTGSEIPSHIRASTRHQQTSGIPRVLLFSSSFDPSPSPSPTTCSAVCPFHPRLGAVGTNLAVRRDPGVHLLGKVEEAIREPVHTKYRPARSAEDKARCYYYIAQGASSGPKTPGSK